jgi:hypothetical protein
LPWRGGETQFVEQLLLGQTVGDDRENIAVHKSVVTRQFAG